MARMRVAPSVYGKERIVEGYCGYDRLYVKRTNVRTYVLSDNIRLSLDTMIAINGQYHFNTLQDIRVAIA